MVAANKLRASGEWVLVRADKHPEKTSGGIYRPQGNLEDRTGMRVGTVLSAGRGRRAVAKPGKPLRTEYISTGVEVGDRVVFRGFLHDVSKYHQNIDGLDHSLVFIEDILAVIEDEEGDVVV